jgi:hypothetical protein
MKKILTMIAGAGIVAGIGLVAISLTNTQNQHDNALISSEQLRLKDIETSRTQRATAGGGIDFATTAPPPVPETQLRQDGERMVVPGTLPPQLAKLKTELDTLNQEMAEAVQTAPPSDTAHIDQLIRKTDALIAQTNQKLGLDTSHIAKELTGRVTPTDPALIELNQKMDTLDTELMDWGKERLQNAR